MTTLELGCGGNPQWADIHHDRVKHSAYVDVAHDLDRTPWPWVEEEFKEITALDVMEHLKVDIPTWLNECHRILEPGGSLDIRVSAWDNPLSYRDPTHQRVFHPETFDYWDKTTQLWRDYGCIYFLEAGRWWSVDKPIRENDDLRWMLWKA